jgi:hypothetical protein
MFLGYKHPHGEVRSNVAAPFRVHREAQAKVCGYMTKESHEHLPWTHLLAGFHIVVNYFSKASSRDVS